MCAPCRQFFELQKKKIDVRATPWRQFCCVFRNKTMLYEKRRLTASPSRRYIVLIPSVYHRQNSIPPFGAAKTTYEISVIVLKWMFSNCWLQFTSAIDTLRYDVRQKQRVSFENTPIQAKWEKGSHKLFHAAHALAKCKAYRNWKHENKWTNGNWAANAPCAHLYSPCCGCSAWVCEEYGIGSGIAYHILMNIFNRNRARENVFIIIFWIFVAAILYRSLYSQLFALCRFGSLHLDYKRVANGVPLS